MGALRKHPPKDAAKTIEDLAAQGHSIIGIAKRLGVSKETFKRWCEEDETLQDTFEVGRDAHRQALVALIMRDAVAGKAANANSMFLLKAMHGFRENDSPNTKVNVGVNVVPNVLVVRDHGTDEEWEARAAEQQKALTLNAASLNAATKVSELPTSATSEAVPDATAPSYAPVERPGWSPPEWRGRG